MNRCACPSINPYECTETRLGSGAEADDLCQCSCHSEWFDQYAEYIEGITGLERKNE